MLKILLVMLVAIMAGCATTSHDVRRQYGGHAMKACEWNGDCFVSLANWNGK